MAGSLAIGRSAHAAGGDGLKIGLIGCGGRGSGAVRSALSVDPGAKLTAMADPFADRMINARKALKTRLKDQVAVDDDHCFSDFNGYRELLDSGVDVAILAEPPHFRPMHIEACVDAGVHVFAEKPMAVDGPGVRQVLASGQKARQKKISFVSGFETRYGGTREVIRRLRDGQIGDVVSIHTAYNTGPLWHRGREDDWTEMQFQMRNWYYFTWLSGDHIVEQHLHNMDIINWAIGSPPVQCLGMGGRQCRTGPEFGNIYDHFTVEYEYANGIRVMSMCSQIKGSTPRVGERVLCTKGAICTNRGEGYIEDVKGNRIFKYEDEIHSGEIAQCANLIRSIREGKPINECKRLAESTMAVILGRLSAYTGRALKWDWAMKASKLDLSPEKYELGDLPVRAVSMPGKTKLI
jgi:predicted dehydrogenase